MASIKAAAGLQNKSNRSIKSLKLSFRLSFTKTSRPFRIKIHYISRYLLHNNTTPSSFQLHNHMYQHISYLVGSNVGPSNKRLMRYLLINCGKHLIKLQLIQLNHQPILIEKSNAAVVLIKGYVASESRRIYCWKNSINTGQLLSSQEVQSPNFCSLVSN